MDPARAALEHYERNMPEGMDAEADFRLQLAMCKFQEDRDHWLEGYRKAGFAV